MTEKQKIFADEYLIDLNATRAYRAAYPNCKKDSSADAAARKLLGNTRIQTYITERMEERQKRTEITQDMVLQELAAIAFSKASDYAKVVEKQATESKSAIASKIMVRRDFKIRFSSSLKSRILSVLLFQVCLREQPQIQIFQSWLRCNRPINFRMFGQITNRNLIVIFASLIDNAQPHFTFRQL